MNCWLPKSNRFCRYLAAVGLGWALWLSPGFGLGCAWSQASYFFHEIQPGETLWAIAKAYGISVERLQEFNGGLEGSSHIKAGEFLIVPADVLERPQPPVVKRPQSASDGGEWAVRPGSVFGSEAPENSAEDAPPGLVVLSPLVPELALVSPIEADKPQVRPGARPQSGNRGTSAQLAPKQQAKPSSSAQSQAADAQAGKSSAAKPQAADAKSGKSAASKSSGVNSGKTVPASSQTKAERSWSQSRAAGGRADKAKDKAASTERKKEAEIALNTAPSASQTVSGGRWRRGQAPRENKGRDRDKPGKDGQQAQKTPEQMVAFAKKFLGTPYVYGGDTPAGFDCSGFVQSVCRYAGVNIPRVADDQYYRAGKPVPKGKERQGDLVFFETDPSWPGPSHVGICVGNGEFIHASSSGSVRIDSLDKEYYKARFLGSKRVLEG
ncbi:MAG: NlpC/P60 family protein [bacterium]|nr:NlpC/P60 family protein [bacterium]